MTTSIICTIPTMKLTFSNSHEEHVRDYYYEEEVFDDAAEKPFFKKN